MVLLRFPIWSEIQLPRSGRPQKPGPTWSHYVAEFRALAPSHAPPVIGCWLGAPWDPPSMLRTHLGALLPSPDILMCKMLQNTGNDGLSELNILKSRNEFKIRSHKNCWGIWVSVGNYWWCISEKRCLPDPMISYDLCAGECKTNIGTWRRYEVPNCLWRCHYSKCWRLRRWAKPRCHITQYFNVNGIPAEYIIIPYSSIFIHIRYQQW